MSMSHSDIRARYPEGQYAVEGEPVGVSQIKVRSMNFGQHWRGENVESIPYQIWLPIKFVIDIVNWQLPAFAADAREFPDEADLLERLLKENGWNTDAQFLLTKGPELLRQMVLEEYAHEMILQWFGDGPAPKDGFILNSCFEVNLKKDKVCISGLCRKSGSSTAYQDQ